MHCSAIECISVRCCNCQCSAVHEWKKGRGIWWGLIIGCKVACALHLLCCTVHTTLHDTASTFLLNTIHCTLYTLHCTLYIVHCTLYNVHCTLYIVHCTYYTVHCTLYIVYCTLYTVLCSLSVHCISLNINVEFVASKQCTHCSEQFRVS